MVVVVRHPELADDMITSGVTDSSVTDDPMDSPLPTPLSTTTHYSRDNNMSTQISLVSFASSLALIYGAAKGKPFYLLPFFCLKVFDFCIACVIAISYLCALPSLHLLAQRASQQAGPEVIKQQLQGLSPTTLCIVVLLAFITALSIKAYLLSIVWRCYRFLSLRRVSGRATVSVLGSAGLAEMGPDYDLHPAAASTSGAAHLVRSGPALAPTTVALLNPPEYSKLKDLPPPPPPPPETPPPPYSSTMNLNRP